MDNEKDNYPENVREKILQGLDLTFKRLVKTKSQNDESFIFYEDGKIITVKAKDLEKKLRLQ